MAIIRPFKAIRPKTAYAQKVAALPYDVMNRAEAAREIQENPYSFLQVDRAEATLDPEIDPYDSKVYSEALKNLQSFLLRGILSEDQKEAFYLYQITFHGRSQTGIVCTAAVDDYLNQIIKKHENTRADKEADRIRHVDILNANTGPIFLIYRQQSDIKKLIQKVLEEKPEISFVADDAIQHKVWTISNGSLIRQFEIAFAKLQRLYIADGHHRCASAAAVAKKRRLENPSYSGEEAFNYFLAVAFPDEELQIYDYNRLVKDLNGLSIPEFLNRLKEQFRVIPIDTAHAKPTEKATFGMYLDHKWYRLTYLGKLDKEDPISVLDVSILQDHVLQPLLGIDDPRTDQRIDFIGGIRGLGELEKLVDQLEMAVAFALFPTSLEELFGVSDQNLLMPPKSTWFEPKLRSGLFIHSLAD